MLRFVPNGCFVIGPFWPNKQSILPEHSRVVLEWNVHSLIFSKRFILVRAVVDLEAIPGTLSPRWEYIQDG